MRMYIFIKFVQIERCGIIYQIITNGQKNRGQKNKGPFDSTVLNIQFNLVRSIKSSKSGIYEFWYDLKLQYHSHPNFNPSHSASFLRLSRPSPIHMMPNVDFLLKNFPSFLLITTKIICYFQKYFGKLHYSPFYQDSFAGEPRPIVSCMPNI